MNLTQRTEAFEKLGNILRNIDNYDFIKSLDNPAVLKLAGTVESVQNHNGWFTPEMVTTALKSFGESLKRENLNRWIAGYKDDIEKQKKPKTIAVVMAGNVPAVGFHDFLTVLVSGNKLLGKLSSDDTKLLPAIAGVLKSFEPEFEKMIELTTERIKDFDAVIATGSNNSARYFEYYFGKYPSVIRKNRNGVAVLTGSESKEDLKNLTRDIFLYYGLGCRNVAKLYLPEGYDFEPLLKEIEKNKEVTENNKYFNNYEYNKAIFLVNKTIHYDTGNLLLTENSNFSSPVSVVHYSFYNGPQALKNELTVNSHNIQCIVSSAQFLKEKVPFGKSQYPKLWDYADGVDTMQFILQLND